MLSATTLVLSYTEVPWLEKTSSVNRQKTLSASNGLKEPITANESFQNGEGICVGGDQTEITRW